MFTKNLSKDSRITIMLMSVVTTLICEIISYIIQMVLFKLSFEILAFIKIILLEIIFNAMIIIIIYPVINILGVLLEKIFTENKILTRYY